jgi:hypothetical protein
MLARRALAPLALSLTAALTLSGAPAAHAASPPQHVVVTDSRTSPAKVDISKVWLDASWYWTSEQSLRVKVPHGFKAGQKLLVWFDVNGDGTPDGHYRLGLRKPKKPQGKWLRLNQQFKRGGGWSRTAGSGASCTNGDGDSAPVFELRKGARVVELALDLWDCLGAKKPVGFSSGSWRAAVLVAKGRKADMAPNGRRWSPAVAGWGPCDPSGGDCP